MGFSITHRLRFGCAVGLSLASVGYTSAAHADDLAPATHLAGIATSDFRLELVPRTAEPDYAAPVDPAPDPGPGVDPATDYLEPVAIVRPKIEDPADAERAAARKKARDERKEQSEREWEEFDRRRMALGIDPPKQRGWSKTMTQAEVALVALRTIDAVQTMKCMDKPTCHEMNLVLGRRPSKFTIGAFALGTTFGHFLLMKLAAQSDRDLGKVLLFASLAGEAVIVGLNFKSLN